MRRSALLLCPVVAFTLVGCGGSDDDDLASCLVGTWDGNPSEMEPVLAHLLSEDADAITLSGYQSQTFRADGTQSVDTYIAIDLASNGPGDDAFEQGTAEGTWSLEGDRLTVTHTSSNFTVSTASRSVPTTPQDGTYLVTCSASTFTSTGVPSTVSADTPDSLRDISFTSQRR